MLAIRPMSGYEIQSTIKKTTANFWSESAGQIYPTLAKLLKDGAVTCKKESSNGGRESKIYSLTKKGVKVLQAWLPDPATTYQPRDELLLKLFFGKNMSQDQCQKLIFKRKQNAEEKLVFFKSIKEHLEKEHKNRDDLPYWLITIDHGIFSARAEIDWSDETLQKFNKFSARR